MKTTTREQQRSHERLLADGFLPAGVATAPVAGLLVADPDDPSYMYVVAECGRAYRHKPAPRTAGPAPAILAASSLLLSLAGVASIFGRSPVATACLFGLAAAFALLSWLQYEEVSAVSPAPACEPVLDTAISSAEKIALAVPVASIACVTLVAAAPAVAALAGVALVVAWFTRPLVRDIREGLAALRRREERWRAYFDSARPLSSAEVFARSF